MMPGSQVFGVLSSVSVRRTALRAPSLAMNPNQMRGFSVVSEKPRSRSGVSISPVSANTPADQELLMYSRKKLTSVSLRSLMETGRGDLLGHTKGKSSDKLVATSTPTPEKIIIQVACFLHRELPVRLAHRAVQLQESPLFLKSVHIQNVCSWYRTSFAQLRSCPVPYDREKEKQFAKVIESIYERHAATLITMAKGAHELRTFLKQDIASFADYNDIQLRLDQFYMSRIGIRMLIGQYLALRDPCNDPDYVGLICLRASPYNIAQQAIDDASYVCTRTHGDAPVVTIHGRQDLAFPYVSSHISYIMMELLKNSMRATVETHGIDDMPPIRVVIADGEDNEDVVIKISDEGGGISRSNMTRIWSYLYTTADPLVLESMLGSTTEGRDFATDSPLAGLGYGLPISRNYARCFGGDLTLMSMEGYGTDSFIYLPRLSNKDNARV